MRRPQSIVSPVAVAFVLASCSENPPSKADAPLRMTRLPDSPCGFLSSADVAAATGLKVVDSRRVRAIGENTGDGSICAYTTQSELGAIVIVFPALTMTEQCKERTPSTNALTENYQGGPVKVCVAPNKAVSVQAQNMIGNGYRATLVTLAGAVLRRVPAE